ncbi:MAG: protein translocase subunit SecF [Chloroflexi bacterium]|nr:protein translocase subunit SecF [Chloroflexota bacterium]
MFDIVQRRRVYFILSGVIIGLGLLAMLFSWVTTGRPFNIGVDFQSGTRFELQFTEPVQEGDIRAVFNEFGVNNPSVIELSGENLTNAWQIRTEFISADDAQAIEETLSGQLAPLVPNTTLVESVSPTVGAEVSQAAFIAILVAAVIMLGYVAFAFRQVPNSFRYGACAISALFHDLLVIFGFISIMGMVAGWEVDALFVTAILTVAGFSLQDTIVVFDRIRENLDRRPWDSYENIVSRSLLETVHRSLATQLNAMFVMVALILFGGASIQHFISVLLVGLLSGTYSSIFHAVPLLAEWDLRRPQEVI